MTDVEMDDMGYIYATLKGNTKKKTPTIGFISHMDTSPDASGKDIKARVIKIDPIERRIGLSIKAASLSDEEFEVKEEMLTGLKPGEDLVDLAGAFDEAFGVANNVQEWRPGEKPRNSRENGKSRDRKDND